MTDCDRMHTIRGICVGVVLLAVFMRTRPVAGQSETAGEMTVAKWYGFHSSLRLGIVVGVSETLGTLGMGCKQPPKVETVETTLMARYLIGTFRPGDGLVGVGPRYHGRARLHLHARESTGRDQRAVSASGALNTDRR